jgi:DNA adenine methylase
MRYLGGKSRIRRAVAETIEKYRVADQSYFEPFVGGAWVLQEIKGVRHAADINKWLITMYKALQDGWIPPENVSEDEYKRYKIDTPEDDPLTAFIGFGCSFAGRWFEGYARSKKRNFAAETKRSLIKQLPLIESVVFKCVGYQDCNPDGMIIYCDPPYAETKKYSGTVNFDSDKFWETMRMWSQNNTVLISEYNAPDDFDCIKKIESRMGLRNNGSENELRIEKIFKLRSQG